MGILYALRDRVPEPHMISFILGSFLSLWLSCLICIDRALNVNPAVMLDLLEKPEFTVALKVTHCCVRYLVFST